MDILFDNIIYSLQSHGGISVVFHEIQKRILKDTYFKCKFIDYPNKNVLGKGLDIYTQEIIKSNFLNLPISFERYLNPKVDINNCIFHSSYYRVAKSNPTISNVTTIHDFTYEYFLNGLPKLIHKYQKGYAINHSKKIICVSEHTKKDLLKFYPHINEDDIVVVYNGVSDDYMPLSIESKMQISELVPYQIGEYVLYVGDRKCTYKNFEMLVEACKLAKSSLVIVGGGDLKSDESLFLTEKLGQTGFIQLMGMSNQQLNLLYNCASFFVYPSLYEGFGIPVLEAQRAGCPVICSDQSSLPEVAGNGAIIIDKINERKIAEILIDFKSRSNVVDIINAGILNSLRFSWDKCYHDTKAVYMSIE